MFGRQKPAPVPLGDVSGAGARVVDLVRSRGYPHASTPSFSPSAIDEREHQLGRPIPASLRRFLEIYDREVWSHLVNPDQLKVGEWRPMINKKGERITGGHPDNVRSDPCGIDSLDEINVFTFTEDHDDELRCLLAMVHDGIMAREWFGTEFWTFDRATFGEPIYFLPQAPGYLPGSLFMVIYDNPGLAWSADSIAHWLTRLVAFGGTDLLIYPGELKTFPRALRNQFVAEFNARNPQISWWK